MKKILKRFLTYSIIAMIGFAAGIYFLPILTAPEGLSDAEVQSASRLANFSGEFRRDLQDSDRFHWGEGTVFLSEDEIVLQGKIAPGPDYKLYLSPKFVETEADFIRLKTAMKLVADVKTFENFMVPLGSHIDLSQYNSVIIWCESFKQFITAAQYQ
jgi:hypothetical protein